MQIIVKIDVDYYRIHFDNANYRYAKYSLFTKSVIREKPEGPEGQKIFRLVFLVFVLKRGKNKKGIF